MILVTIESPFTGDIKRNTAYARAAIRDSILRGEAPLASHLLYPQILDDRDPEERKLGINCGLAWARQSSLMAFYVDLGFSKGMLQAKTFAFMKHIKTEERKIDGWAAIDPGPDNNRAA